MSKDIKNVMVEENLKTNSFEPQELDREDYLPTESAAAMTRGAIKGFAGGSLMTLGFCLIRSSKSKGIIKPFCGSLVGMAGTAFVADSFCDWEKAARGFGEVIVDRLYHKIHS